MHLLVLQQSMCIEKKLSHQTYGRRQKMKIRIDRNRHIRMIESRSNSFHLPEIIFLEL